MKHVFAFDIPARAIPQEGTKIARIVDRTGRVRRFPVIKTRSAKFQKLVRLTALRIANEQEVAIPIEQPCAIYVAFLFAPAKSAPAALRRAVQKGARPAMWIERQYDGDNLLYNVFNALKETKKERGIVADDSQFYFWQGQRQWNKTDSISIYITWED
jgi:Holliday junction resolvase RusA-like endonuclease